MENSMKLKKSLAAASIALGLGAGGALVAAAPANAYEVLFVYHYSSLSQCSQSMDYYAQHYDIIQGCTVTATVNGVPVQWRLMVGRA